MKNKLLKNTVSVLKDTVVKKALKKATSIKKPVLNSTKSTSANKLISPKRGKMSNINNILNIFNIISTLAGLLAPLYKVLGPKLKIFASLAPILLVSWVYFRKSFKVFAFFTAGYTIVLFIISIYTGEDVSFKVSVLTQILSIPFVYILDKLNISYESIIQYFKDILDNISNKIEDLNNEDAPQDKGSNITQEMKKTHEAVKDTDIIKNSIPNYNHYYVIAGILASISIIAVTLYFNPYGVTDLLSGCYHACLDFIKDWTSSWFRPKGDDGDSFFKRIRWSAIFTPWKRSARLEDLRREAQNAASGLNEFTTTVWNASDDGSDIGLHDFNPSRSTSYAGNVNTEQAAFDYVEPVRETIIPEPLNDPFPFPTDAGNTSFDSSSSADSFASSSSTVASSTGGSRYLIRPFPGESLSDFISRTVPNAGSFTVDNYPRTPGQSWEDYRIEIANMFQDGAGDTTPKPSDFTYSVANDAPFVDVDITDSVAPAANAAQVTTYASVVGGTSSVNTEGAFQTVTRPARRYNPPISNEIPVHENRFSIFSQK